MSRQPAPAPVPDRQLLDENAAASIRAYAAEQHREGRRPRLGAGGHRGAWLPDRGVRCAAGEARDAHLERLADEQQSLRVA